MPEFISISSPVAKKDHYDSAKEWIDEYLYYCNYRGTRMTIGELRAVSKARKNGWLIRKGEKYVRYVGKYEGQLFVTKESPEMRAICIRLKLYPEV